MRKHKALANNLANKQTNLMCFDMNKNTFQIRAPICMISLLRLFEGIKDAPSITEWLPPDTIPSERNKAKRILWSSKELRLHCANAS